MKVFWKTKHRSPQIPKIIHQVWLGDKSLMPIRWMNSWQQMNPHWEYKLWTETNLPELKNQRLFDLLDTWPKITTELDEKINDATSYQSDVIRYEVLCKFGGFYADADSQAMKPLDELLDCECFSCWERENKEIVASGFVGSVPDSPFMNLILNQMQHTDIAPTLTATDTSFQFSRILWGLLGPGMLTSLARQYPLLIKILPFYMFYPINQEGLASQVEKSYAIHFWGGRSKYLSGR